MGIYIAIIVYAYLFNVNKKIGPQLIPSRFGEASWANNAHIGSPLKRQLFICQIGFFSPLHLQKSEIICLDSHALG